MKNFTQEQQVQIESRLREICMDRAIIKYCDDPKKISVIYKRLNEMSYDQLLEGVGRTILSVLGLINSPLLWVIYRTIKASGEKCFKQCGTYSINTSKRQQCIKDCKDEKAKKTQALLKKMSSKCAKSKDPEDCQRKLRMALNEL